MSKICALPSCGKEFEPPKFATSQKYCSPACTREAKKLRVKGGLNPDDDSGSEQPELFTQPKPTPSAAKKTESPSSNSISLGAILHDLPPAARFIIMEQEKQNTRLTVELKEEKEARKKDAELIAKQDKELNEIKQDNKLNGLIAENKGPDFLEGLLNNEHMGPVIAGLAQKLVDAIPAPGSILPAANLTGAQEVPENLRTQAAQIVDWFAKQEPEVQQVFFALVSDMAGKEPGELKLKMGYIKNMLRYDTNFN